MIILIDAYNVLKAHVRGTISSTVIEEFLGQLTSYGRKKGHTLVTVFDGGSFNWPHQDKRKHVTTIYSGYQSTADDVIKKIVATSQNKDILLVSSDRALCLYAEEYQIPSINPEDFMPYVRMKHERYPTIIEGAGPMIKHASQDSDDALDELMEEGSRVLLLKEEIEPALHVPQARSKIERKLLKIVAKL